MANLVPIIECDDPSEATFIAGALINEGIQAELSELGPAGVFPVPGALCTTRVLVPEVDVPSAEDVLDVLLSKQEELDHEREREKEAQYPSLAEMADRIDNLRLLHMVWYGTVLIAILAFIILGGLPRLSQITAPLMFFIILGGWIIGMFVSFCRCPRCGNRFHSKWFFHSSINTKCLHCGFGIWSNPNDRPNRSS